MKSTGTEQCRTAGGHGEESRGKGELRRTDESLNLLENLPVYVALLTPDYRIPYSNRFFQERFGKAGGKRCYEALFGRSSPCDVCETFKVLMTGRSHQWEWTGPDGREYYVYDEPFIDAHGQTLILELGVDVTEQVNAKRETEKKEEQLKYAQRVAHVGSWELDLLSNRLTWSDEIYRIFEIDSAQFGASYDAFLALIHPDDRERVNKAYLDSVAYKKPYSIRHRLLLPDGRIKYVHERCETVYNAGGQPVLSVGTVQDISEQMRIEEQLRKNQDLLNETQRITRLGGWEYDVATGRVMWSDEVYRIHGVSKEEYDPSHPEKDIEFYAPEDRRTIHEAFRRTVEEGIPYDLELRLITATGISIWVRTMGRAQKENGRVVRVVGNIMDITARRQVEAELRERSKYERGLIEASLDPLVTISPAGKITDVNQATVKVTGVERQLLIGSDFCDYFTEPEEARKGYLRVLKEGSVRDYPLTIQHASGETTDVLYNATIYRNERGDVQGVFAAARDVTERKRADRQLRESEERYRKFFDDDLTADYIKGPDGGLRACNAAFARVFGFPSIAAALKANMKDHYVDLTDREHFLTMVRSSGKVELHEMAMRRVDGVPISVIENAIGEFDNDGNLAEIRGYIFDITRRKEAEEKVRRSEAQYRDLFNSVPVGLYRTTPAGNILDANPALVQILGFSSKEELMQANSVILYVDHEERTHWREILERDGLVSDYEIQVRRRDGNAIWIRHSARALRDSSGKVQYYEGAVTDITLKKEAEEKLRNLNRELEFRVQERTARLEAANKELEAFAYSVSHDLRAPLRSIDGFTEALAEDYAPLFDERARSYFGRIQAAARRMAQLIDDILQLSRVSRSDMNVQAVNLSRIAQRTAEGLKSLEPERNVEFTITPDLNVEGDPNLLTLVLENLLGNAWKFTSTHARAKIEFGITDQGNGPEFFVRDDGAGFDMNYADKLFGAFQRLHEERDFPGTGIGLATVQRILARHGGTVRAEGKVDQGATIYFTISDSFRRLE